MHNKLLYIHGLGSDRNSRKFINLKDYFQDQFEYDFVEWNNESNISALLDSAEKWLISESESQIVLIGDSTGANFAYQLQERLEEKNISPILILTSPLLDIDDRIADFEFPKSILPQLEKILNPKNALIIASKHDEVLNQLPLFEKSLHNVELLNVDDSHRLLNFENCLEAIESYIKSKS